MKAGHRLRGGVGGCLSGIVWGEKAVGSEISEFGQTHTHIFEYPLGKPLEAKPLKELKEVCTKYSPGNSTPTTEVCTAEQHAKH